MKDFETVEEFKAFLKKVIAMISFGQCVRIIEVIIATMIGFAMIILDVDFKPLFAITFAIGISAISPKMLGTFLGMLVVLAFNFGNNSDLVAVLFIVYIAQEFILLAVDEDKAKKPTNRGE